MTPRPIPLLLALVGVAPIARAQSAADLAARQELVVQADAARERGEHPRALDLATRASLIRMTPSLQLLIAQEQRQLGQLVEAYASGLACARGAVADPGLRNRESIRATCEALSRELDPMLGRVRVRLPADAPPDTQLRVAAAEVPAALRDQPRLVTPGAVVVTATAAGRVPFRRELRVAAGSTPEVDVTLAPELAAVETPGRGPGVAPWIVVGVGAAGLATAGVLFGLATTAQSDRDTQCTRDGCQGGALDLDARYRDLALGGNLALGVGAAAVVGGVVWYLVARRRPAVTASAPTLAITF